MCSSMSPNTDVLTGPAKALFRTIRAKKVAKVPSPSAASTPRLKAANVFPIFLHSMCTDSSATGEMDYNHSLPFTMVQDYTHGLYKDHDAMVCDTFPPIINYISSHSLDNTNAAASSYVLPRVPIPIPDKTNMSGRLAELPIPVFRPSIMLSVIPREPMKTSPERFESPSLSPGIPASYASSEPRGIKRKSPDDALALSPQSEKKLLCLCQEGQSLLHFSEAIL